MASPSNASTKPSKKYRKKQKGAVATVNGPVYNIKLLMWHLLNFDTRNDGAGDDFVIMSEWVKAQLVDDIVLLYGKKENDRHPHATFKQLKHKKNDQRNIKNKKKVLTITKSELLGSGRANQNVDGDFRIRKYYDSFCEIIASGKFESNEIKHIAMVTNIDLNNGIEKYFEIDDEEESVLKLPGFDVFKLKIDSSDQQFLNQVKMSLGISPSQTLVNKLYEKHGQQTVTKNALTDVGLFKTYRSFLSKHVLEPHPENIGYLKFQETFLLRDYGSDAFKYSHVIDEFWGALKAKFGSQWENTKFKASSPFYISDVPQLIKDEVPYRSDDDKVREFIEKLRIVKTPNEAELSDQIKNELSSKFDKFEADIVHDMLFVKMLDWYRNPKGVGITASVVKDWLKGFENLLHKKE